MPSQAQYVDIPTAARLMSIPKRTLQRQCKSGELDAIKNDRQWMIHRSVDPRLHLTSETADTADRLQAVPPAKRQQALKKLGVIKQFEYFEQNFATRKQAVQMFCQQQDFTPRTFYRWLSDYKQSGLIGLVDTRGRSGGEAQLFSPEAAKMFKGLWLDLRQPSVKACWQDICHYNATNDLGWQIPQLRSMYNWINENIPQPTQILMRQGKEAYESQCAPYIQKDIDSVMPGQIWVGDHHQFNCWVRHRNKWIRPWLTMWMDMRTRKMVGWDVNANPNQVTILQAMRHGIESDGPCEIAKIDNGKDYDSQMWTGKTKRQRRLKVEVDEEMVAGIYGMLGIAASFSIAYHPQSKSVERLFDTVDMQFTKTIDTYCGKDSARKPEDLEGKLKSDWFVQYKSMTLDEFAELFERYAEVYNNAGHTGDGMNGDSPNQVMARRVGRRYVDSDVLDMLLCVWSGKLKVGKNGVRFRNMLYGQYEPELLCNFGKYVRVAYNPDDLRTVSVHDANSLDLLCIAEQNQLVKYGANVDEESLRTAMAQKSRAKKLIKNIAAARRDAHIDLTDLALEAMDAASQPEPEKKTHNIIPVASKLRSTAKKRKLELNNHQLKKAVGAEDMPGLGLNHDKLKERTKPKLGLFEK